MHKQLADVVSAFESAQERLHRLTDQLSDARWKSRPGPERWSAAECVEHLNLTSRAYVPLLRRALEQAPKGAAKPKRYRRDFLGWLFTNMVGPIPGVGKLKFPRVKTTPDFVPKPVGSRVEIVAEFDRLQAELIGLARRADGLPLGEMKIVSPFGGKIRYNVYSALRILPAHQERHLDQAEEATNVRKTN